MKAVTQSISSSENIGFAVGGFMAGLICGPIANAVGSKFFEALVNPNIPNQGRNLFRDRLFRDVGGFLGAGLIMESLNKDWENSDTPLPAFFKAGVMTSNIFIMVVENSKTSASWKRRAFAFLTGSLVSYTLPYFFHPAIGLGMGLFTAQIALGKEKQD